MRTKEIIFLVIFKVCNKKNQLIIKSTSLNSLKMKKMEGNKNEMILKKWNELLKG